MFLEFRKSLFQLKVRPVCHLSSFDPIAPDPTTGKTQGVRALMFCQLRIQVLCLKEVFSGLQRGKQSHIQAPSGPWTRGTIIPLLTSTGIEQNSSTTWDRVTLVKATFSVPGVSALFTIEPRDPVLHFWAQQYLLVIFSCIAEEPSGL